MIYISLNTFDAGIIIEVYRDLFLFTKYFIMLNKYQK